jgi:hypothetical protein
VIAIVRGADDVFNRLSAQLMNRIEHLLRGVRRTLSVGDEHTFVCDDDQIVNHHA